MFLTNHTQIKVRLFHQASNMYEDEDSDYLDFGGDSDDGRVESESSEDELDILLNASPEQRRQLQQRRKQEKAVVEDDFEREMNAELEERVTELEAQRSQAGQFAAEERPKTSSSGQGEVNQDAGTANSTQFYDDIYFDSDEDEGRTDKDNISPNRKRPIPSNDDLLYDPNMDAEDEKWVAKRRQGSSRKAKQSKTDNKTNSKLPQSDAVLDCPACMTTLCRDCQRHDMYENQYRAMFVSNCVIDKSELLKFPERKGKKKKKKKPKEESQGDESDDKYNPVKCTQCNTVVAMYDKEEIYHFFNVLASYS